MPVSRRKKTSRRAPGYIFLIFITIAFMTVILLEYLDFKKGKPSFIFTKIIPISADKEVSSAVPFNSRLLSMLKSKGIKYDFFKDRDEKYHYNIEIPAADYKKFLKWIQELLTSVPHQLKLKLSEIQKIDQKTIYLYNIISEGETTHIVLITAISPPSPTEKEKPKKESKHPKLAFIIDDIGNNDRGALQLKKLDIPITGSVLPHAPFAYDEARQLHMYGLETMIHLPMQRINSQYKKHNPYRLITPQSSQDEIRELIQSAKQMVPYARGINNHEGSLVTADKEAMNRVLKIIKEEGMFFVDSRTSSKTVAYQIAKKLKMKTAERNVFLEDIGNGDTTYEYSVNQIKKLIQLAKQKNKAIAIGHPYETTFHAIRDSIPRIKAEGIEIVYVSTILD